MKGQAGKDDTGSSSQVYICPKGFSGDYKLLVRRVWGEVTDNKVTVELYTHFRGPKQTRQVRAIPLEKDKALVTFALADGRRTESLKDAQLATAAMAHLVMKQQQVLAQVFAPIDPGAMAALAASRNNLAAVSQANAANAANAGSPGAGGGVPDFFPIIPRAGAVGYQPVIIVLPEGTNLSATAVISADRRYVRVSCMPLFSGIAKVDTFNMSSGATQVSSNQGTGGQGYSGQFGAQGNGGVGAAQQNNAGGGGGLGFQ
jgi:hypothetical protein